MRNNVLLPEKKFDVAILEDIELGYTNPNSLTLYNFEGTKKRLAQEIAIGQKRKLPQLKRLFA